MRRHPNLQQLRERPSMLQPPAYPLGSNSDRAPTNWLSAHPKNKPGPRSDQSWQDDCFASVWVALW